MTNVQIGTIALPLDSIITIPMEASVISESGCEEIRSYLRNQTFDRKGKSRQSGYALSFNLTGEFLDWSWKTKNGTFPKRLSKYLYQEYDVILTQDQIAHIGQLARGNSTDTNKFYMDITQHINWEDGDFGDEGSCYWGGRQGALHMLQNNGAYAVRFYNIYENHEESSFSFPYKGFARCWFVEQTINGKQVFILFNGYGLTVLQIVHILSEYTGMYYRKILLSNKGSTTGQLWIGARNAENHGSGYIMGDMLDIKSIEKHDFDWFEEDAYECSSCGRGLDEDSTYEHNGDIYCSSCFHDTYASCDFCDEYHYQDDMHYPEDWTVCDSCYEENFTVCSVCDEAHRSRFVVYLEGVGDVCENCQEHYIECDECNNYFELDKIYPEDGITICLNCKKELEEAELSLMDQNGLE